MRAERFVVLIPFLLASPAAALTPPSVTYQTLFGVGSQGIGVSADSAGNAYVLSNTVLISPGLQVAKLSPSGSVLWTQTFPASGSPYANDVVFPTAISADPAGNSYISATDVTAEVGFLLKYGPDGTLTTVTVTPNQGRPFYPFVSGVAYDPTSGHVYAAESFNNPANGRASDLLAMEYDGSLQNLLNSQVVDEGNANIDDSLEMVTVDPGGNVYLAGERSDYTTSPQPCGSVVDWQTIRFSPHLAGMSKLSTRFTPPCAFQHGIAADTKGNFWGVGDDELLDFTVAAELTKNTGKVDQVHLGATDSFYGAAIDASGNAYVGAYTPLFPSPGKAHLRKYAPDGANLWDTTTFTADNGASFGNNVAVDSRGDIYMTGGTQNQTIVLKYSQTAATQQLKMVLGTPTVAPADPQIPGVTLAGRATTSVEVDLVDAQGKPIAQQAKVSMTVTAVDSSGGHSHTGNKPVGTLSGPGITPASSIVGTTDANGKLLLVYASPSVGGEETITATLSVTPSISTSSVIVVSVIDQQGFPFADLSALPISSIANLTGNSGTTSYPGCPGATLNHPSNHWASGDTGHVKFPGVNSGASAVRFMRKLAATA